jgi:hypothetical protein
MIKCKPGTIYYLASCGCILEKSQVIKRKRYDAVNSRQPLINACPDHPKFIIERIVKCIDCGKISSFDPGNGGLSERCRPCGIINSKKKAKEKRIIKALEKACVKKSEPLKNSTPIRFEQENMKVFRSPKAALTLEQAALRGIACIPADNLFKFHRDMIGIRV